jgi:glutamate/tyrosine decarboxylase-like PLP-dependent enzyme
MTLETASLGLLQDALIRLEESFDEMPHFEPALDLDQWRDVLNQAADRLHENLPYAHPLYAGQMQKPPHPVARMAYLLTMWINPNNQSIDASPASSAMEKEAVAAIAGIFGWKAYLGHLTTSGTIANMESLWVSGELTPGGKVLASSQAHYTHSLISRVLKLPFQSVPTDATGRMDCNALEDMLQKEDIAVVVATVGTTATGSVDPLHEILDLREKYGFRVHVDAAYGGYFALVDDLSEPVQKAFARISEVDSIVVDPHKHGLQPYGCGCTLFKDPSVGRFYKHDSPYTYFTSAELHLGEISLECSRAGASAAALWATQQLLPMERGGEFAGGLSAGHSAAMDLYHRLATDDRFIVPFAPDLDIIVWALSGASSVSEMSRLSKRFFEAAAARNLHITTTDLPLSYFTLREGVARDQDKLTCLRSCLMKPEHKDWMDTIFAIIDQTFDDI